MRINAAGIYTHTLCIRIKSAGNYTHTLCISINSSGYYTHTLCVYALFRGNNGHRPCVSTVFRGNNKQPYSISVLFNRKNYPAYCLSVASSRNKTQTQVNKPAGHPTGLPRAGMRWQGSGQVCRSWGCVGRATDRATAGGDEPFAFDFAPAPLFYFCASKNGSNKWRY